MSCEDGFYFKNNYCCANDELHRDNVCISKVDAEANCNIFDYSTYTCTLCDTDYYLDNDYCCQNGYDTTNSQCYDLIDNCETYDISTPNKCL